MALLPPPLPIPPTDPAPTPSILRPSIAFVANPNSIAIGTTSRLTWMSLRTNDCELKEGTSVIANGTSGSVTTSALSQNTTFTLTCVGDNGTGTASATVYVGQAAPASASSQLSAPAPTLTATSGTGGASSSSSAGAWCDPEWSWDVFVACLERP